ncbi:hypothetical protein D9M68_618970 [compost metagenome]
MSEGAIVERLPSFRIFLQQRYANHSGLEVIGNEAADHVCTLNILPYLSQRSGTSVVGIRDHPACTQAFSGDLRPHGVGCPQRLQVAAVHPGDVKDPIGNLTQRFQILPGKDVSVGVFYQHSQHIALRTQDFLEFQVVGNEWVTGRNHPSEAGIRAQGQGRIAE